MILSTLLLDQKQYQVLILICFNLLFSHKWTFLLYSEYKEEDQMENQERDSKQWPKKQELMDAKKEIADLNNEVQEQNDETFLYEKNNSIFGDLFEKWIIDKDRNLL